MKPPISPQRTQSDDTVGMGIEAGLMLVIFAGVGALLDRSLGTFPALTIILMIIGAVGLFTRFKASYAAKMDELARERKAASRGQADRP